MMGFNLFKIEYFLKRLRLRRIKNIYLVKGLSFGHLEISL